MALIYHSPYQNIKTAALQRLICTFALLLNRLDLRLLPVGYSTATDKAASLLTLDTATHANVLIEDEAPDGIAPALVAGQVIIEFVSNLAHFMKTSPRHCREVVVLVVKSDVVGEPVEGPIVREGLGDGDLVLWVASGGSNGLVHVVLGDEVASQRVKTPSQKGGEQQVEKRVDRGVLQENEIKGDLDSDVEGVNSSQRNAVDGHRSQSVEEDLESAEEGLSENRIQNEGLEGSGKIGIKAIDTEGLVVGKVVWSERSAVRNANGKVGKDSDQTVETGASESQVMGDLVDGEEKILVGSGAKDVGDSPELP